MFIGELLERYRVLLNVALTSAICVCYASMMAYKVIEINSKNFPRKKKKAVKNEMKKEFEKSEKLAENLKNILLFQNKAIDCLIKNVVK